MSHYAIRAFNTGTDNYGETVTGTGQLEYHTYDKTNPHWVMTVLLVQKDGHECTSGIGFYKRGTVLKPCSGKILRWEIEITPEIQEELDNAVHCEY